MNEENEIIGGLKLTAPDTRNFKLGAIFDLPDPKDLPTDFSLPPVKIKHQGKNNPRNDKCAAYATCSASEIQEGVELNPDFVFAVAKSYEGDEEGFGLELSSAFKAHAKVGAIEEKDVPSEYDLEGTKARYLSYWDSELIKKAFKNKKASYFQVTGPYDPFDNIRASIYKFKDKKQGVVFGCIWGWTNGHIYMTETQKKGYGHALLIVGWARRNGQDWLKIQNSGGERAGEQGYHYFSRKVINDSVREYGALMMVDMDREDAEWYLNNDIKVPQNTVVTNIYKIQIIKELISLWKRFAKTFKEEEGETPVVPPIPPAPVEKPIEIDTMNKLINAIIMVESGGLDTAIGDKHLTHKAYGPMQIRQPAVIDVNNYLGTKYKAEDCLGNRELSIKIFKAYMEIYCTEKRLGRKVTDEDRARTWNGGPFGYKSKLTEGYWLKVKKYL